MVDYENIPGNKKASVIYFPKKYSKEYIKYLTGVDPDNTLSKTIISIFDEEYSINIIPPDGGTIVPANGENKYKYAFGETPEFKIVPDVGKTLSAWTDNDVSIGTTSIVKLTILDGDTQLTAVLV